tara:strand:- start:15140 stop:15916 length:777 start_codon:yes stop_codon:yes gene_type:complete
VFIIDNNSKDKTVEEILKYDQENLILLKNSKNFGFTKAVNQGISKSKGDYIFILNPDTKIEVDIIKKLSNKLNSNPKIAVAAPQLRFPDGRIQYSCRRFPTYTNILIEILRLYRFKKFQGWKMRSFDHKTQLIVDQPAGAALFIRRSIINHLYGLDERFPMFFSDVDLCKRIKDLGLIIMFYPNIIVYHKGGSSIFRRRVSMIVSSHISMIKYFIKHHYSLRCILPNLLIAFFLIISIPIRILIYFIYPNYGKIRNTL